jgi:hypothetical protein
MARLKWDKTGERFWETGVDRVVLYIGNSAEAWSGVTAINESPSGAEPTKIYADNVMYGVVMSPEENSLLFKLFSIRSLLTGLLVERNLPKEPTFFSRIEFQSVFAGGVRSEAIWIKTSVISYI